MKKNLWQQPRFLLDASLLVMDTFSPWTIGPQEQTSHNAFGTHCQMIPIFGNYQQILGTNYREQICLKPNQKQYYF